MKKKLLIGFTLGALMATSLLANKQIVIDLSKQELTAFENGKAVIKTKVSTGRYTHKTPSGNFHALSKQRKHKSTLYPKRASGRNGGADMPYTIGVTKGGVAIHQGYVPRAKSGETYPDSHGCIRVPKGTAKRLYNWTTIGTPIKITGKTKYVDYYNKLRKKYTHRTEDTPIEVIERYEDEFHEWGDNYYDDDFRSITYEDGDLLYLDNL